MLLCMFVRLGCSFYCKDRDHFQISLKSNSFIILTVLFFAKEEQEDDSAREMFPTLGVAKPDHQA